VLSCPSRGETAVTLSAFRRLERLPGAVHPAVFAITFSCACGDEHPGLVAHDELDWAPLGLDEGTTYVNLMTSRREDLSTELSGLATARIGRGEWPWCFFCRREGAARPVTPSAFRLLAPGRGTVAVAVRCPVCDSTSVNVVTPTHVDVPFHTDAVVGVAAESFETDALRTIDTFRAELRSVSFDERRLVI